MNVPVLWCSKHDEILARGYADQGFLEATLDRTVWQPPDAITFEHHEIRGDFPDVEGALVVINCRTHASPEDVAWFTGQLDRLSWSVVFLCGDEEWIFPWQEVPETPTRKVWVMQARPGHAHLSGFLPGGWYPGTPQHLRNADPADRHLDWFFGGQINHPRREQCAEVLRGLHGGELVTTKRYLQEVVPKARYFELMASAKVIPCPSGPYSVDCARTFEALEAGCIPVADTVTARAGAFDYWALLFREEPPFPRLADWADFPGILDELLDGWSEKANGTFAWWQQQKRVMARQLDADLRTVAGHPSTSEAPDDVVTVLITSSPTPLHPSTLHLEQTVASVRHQLPAAEIVIVCDGVRPEQEHLRADYTEYVRRLLWLCNFEWSNVVPVVLPEWGHQANSTRSGLQFVETPLVLFVEHDTPLVGDIDWPGLCRLVTSGEGNAIRLHQDVELHPDHLRVMLDRDTQLIDGVPCRRTSAWWQRPHLASARFYRQLLAKYFPESSRTMIEDRLYGEMFTACEDRGFNGWADWKVWVYTPDGDMRRSGHLDSRGDEAKYDMRFE